MASTAVEIPLVDHRNGHRAGTIVDRGRKNRLAWLTLFPLVCFLILALAVPFASSDPTAQALTDRLQEPGFLHRSANPAAGTDSLGRDLMARIAQGARLSLVVGILAGTLSAIVGVLAGLTGGLRPGGIEVTVTAVGEISLSVPVIVLGIVVVATVGQGLGVLTGLLVFTGWIGFARVVRLQVRSVVRRDFVVAARAIGVSDLRLAFHHVWPSVMPIVMVLWCQQVAAVMVWESTLTYLGIGLPIEQISLGGLIRDGQQHIHSAWWISVFPGLAIALAVVGFTSLGDVLQRMLEPGASPWSSRRRWSIADAN